MTRAAWIPAGIVVWALHFAVLYGFTALACARGFAAAVPWVGGFATAAAIAAMVLIFKANLSRRGEFSGSLALGLAALAVAAIVFEAIPLFMVPICA